MARGVFIEIFSYTGPTWEQGDLLTTYVLSFGISLHLISHDVFRRLGRILRHFWLSSDLDFRQTYDVNILLEPTLISKMPGLVTIVS